MTIDDKALSHLFALSRIEEEKDEKKREKLKEDLSKILDHFNELKELNTQNVEPLAGANFSAIISRADGEELHSVEEKEREQTNILEQFPHKERGYLKVPPVFE